MIILTQLLFYYYWILPFRVDYLSLELFSFVVLATVCIAAGGNIINDIYDVTTDRINKPHKLFIDTFISKKNAYILYFLFTFVGISVGSYAGFAIDRWWISLLFIGISVLLFLYSFSLKSIVILGNIVVATLVASSIFILLAFDIHHLIIGDYVNLAGKVTFTAIVVYGFFAFWINLMREMIKDIEDINGDYNANITTLPIILGRNRVNKILVGLAGILIIFILYITHTFLQGKTIVTIYTLMTILLPLLYFCLKIWQADTKREYRMLSLLLKLIMLFGILSTLVFYYFDPVETVTFLL
jgi:4-hydroxybenzoate polyprenyltransferase